jgi:pimeloyl-ACP methyl ester carboxylesterase
LNTDAAPAVENESPIARDYSAQSDVLVVSFSGLKRNPEKMPGFSLRGTLDGLEVKKLYVRDLDKAWFLRGLHGMTTNVEETAQFLRAEIRTVNARRVVFTGYSLGGFAALLYGALSGAHEVHAISPQTFIGFWQRLRAGDHRWRRYVLPLHFSGTRKFHDLRPWLASAPAHLQSHIHFARDSRLDALHAEHVRALPQVNIHEYTEGAHRLVTAMRESGKLRAIFERASATGETLRRADGKL